MNRTALLLIEQVAKLHGNFAEVGVWKGDFSKEILCNTKCSMLWLIDAWKSFDRQLEAGALPQERFDRLYTFVKNRYKNNSRVAVIREESLAAVRKFPEHFFDFVYLDSCHQYEFVQQELCVWWPLVKVGGIFAGHDYIDRPPVYGVKKAVDEFCTRNFLQLYTTVDGRKNPSWFVLKGGWNGLY